MISSEIKPDEKVLWSSGLHPFAFFSKGLLALTAFGIFWTAGSVYWVAEATRFQIPHNLFEFLFASFGIPFVLVGLGILSLPLFAIKSARKSAYVLTSQRAIIFHQGGIGGTLIQSFSITDLHHYQKRIQKDGSGDIIFKSYTPETEDHPSSPEEGFFKISNVSRVESILLELLKNLPHRTSVSHPFKTGSTSLSSQPPETSELLSIPPRFKLLNKISLLSWIVGLPLWMASLVMFPEFQGSYLRYTNRSHYQNAVFQVTEYEESHDDTGDHYYLEGTINDKIETFTNPEISKMGQNNELQTVYKIGQKIPVKYDPNGSEVIYQGSSIRVIKEDLSFDESLDFMKFYITWIITPAAITIFIIFLDKTYNKQKTTNEMDLRSVQ